MALPLGRYAQILLLLLSTMKWSEALNDEDLINQVAGVQFDQTERARGDMNSGVLSIRLTNSGTRPYHAHSHTGFRFIAMHNHANNIKTVGLGEMKVLMNGVEFQTRHNDYFLMQPSTTSSVLHETELIEFPDVPEAVTNKPTVDEQVYMFLKILHVHMP